MIYKSERLLLGSVWEVYHGPVNDVVVCEELKLQAGRYYTLLIIRDHSTAKCLLEALEQAREQGREAGIDLFTHYGDLCLVFEYQQDRPLSQFCASRRLNRKEREEICGRLVLECLGCGLAWPLLYLIVTQNQIHAETDGSIYFSFRLDLSELDADIGEKECAACIGSLVCRILSAHAGRDAAACSLLQKKLEKGGCQNLTELYRDMKLAGSFGRKIKLSVRFLAFLKRNEDRLFRILLVLCIVFGIVAFIMLVSQFIWGDIPLMRLFRNPFERIGTQSLLQ